MTVVHQHDGGGAADGRREERHPVLGVDDQVRIEARQWTHAEPSCGDDRERRRVHPEPATCTDDPQTVAVLLLSRPRIARRKQCDPDPT